MFRSKGELSTCAGIVFRFLCGQRVASQSEQLAEEGKEAPSLSEEEARRGFYIVYGVFPTRDVMTQLSGPHAPRISERAFTQFITAHGELSATATSTSTETQTGVPIAPESIELTLFASLAGPKGFITYEDLVQADHNAALFAMPTASCPHTDARDTNSPDAWRRRRLLFSLFRSTDTDSDGKLLFKDVKPMLATPPSPL